MARVTSYAEYLLSPYWQDVKRRWIESGLSQCCAVCGDPNYQLHHKTYERLGRELLTDLEPLCERHHAAIHGVPYEEGSWEALKRRQCDYRKTFAQYFGVLGKHYCYFCREPINGHTRPLDSRAAVVHHADGNRGNHYPLNLKPAHHGCHMTYHQTERWKDPQQRERASARWLELWSDSDYRERQVASRRASWQNPDRRAKARQANTGEANGFYGRTHTDETRLAIAQAQRKAWSDPGYREKLTTARKGRAVSSEHRAKISAALKGRVKSPEERANISAGLRGRKYSDKTRAKLAAKQKGRKLPDEVKAKIRAASRGSGNPSAKLTEEDVRGIRRLIGTQTLVSIARQFGVSVHAIRRIRDGKAWTHVR